MQNDKQKAPAKQKLKMIIFPKDKAIPTGPNGYKIRNYRDENDILAWVEICKNGLLGDGAGAEAFEKDITGLKINPYTDVFFIENEKGEAIATITAVDNFRDTGIGNIHMVSVATSERGKGLGHILCAVAEKKLYDNKVKMAALVTDDWRKAACKAYLKAGFLPVNYDSDMIDRWSALLREFGICAVTAVDENGNEDTVIYAESAAQPKITENDKLA